MDQAFAAEFAALKRRIGPILTGRDSAIKRSSPNFEPLRLLGIDGLERTHSKILADLLDPLGTHAQGHLFLSRFVEKIQLNEHAALLNSSTDEIQVESEYVIPEGRLDLLIRMPPHLVIVIENKVSSGEGKSQLKRYRDWLNRQRKYGKKVLVYLTPRVDDSIVTSEEPDRRLSYESDVSDWLCSCLPGLRENTRIHGFLLAYIDLVKRIGARTMSPVDKELNDVLWGADNVKTAYDVWQAFGQSIDQLYLRFWKFTQGKIRGGLRSRGVKTWESHLSEDEELLSASYPGLSLEPISRGEDDLYCTFLLQRDSRFQPYYGICYSKEVRRGSDEETRIRRIPVFKKLEEDLRIDGFNPSGKWWLGRKDTAIQLRDRSTIIQLASDSPTIQARAAEYMLSLFDKYRAAVEQINATLR